MTHPQPLIPDLIAHHLRITLTVETAIELDDHPGSALRGMVFNALRGPKNNPALGFCVQRHLTACAACPLIAACPVASLVSTMNPAAERGRDVPRPYTIEPPLTGPRRYEPGDSFSFGLTLFGEALNLFPYLVMALRQAGAYGLGKKLPQPTAGNSYRRGRFSLQAVRAVNRLTGEAQEVLMPGSNRVQQPALPVTQPQIEAEARRLLSLPLAGAANGHQPLAAFQRGYETGPLALTIHFQTPTRIIHQEQLLKSPHFSPLFHRLLDRLASLNREYVGEKSAAPVNEPDQTMTKSILLALADTVELVDDQTTWREVWSYSNRQGRRIPISGLTGAATYRAGREAWAVLLPFLLWGSAVHIGKNAVKGEGLVAVSG
jgi:hypothetical protein